MKNKLFTVFTALILLATGCSEDSSTLAKLEKTMEGFEELSEQTKIVDDILNGVDSYKDNVINLSSLKPAEKSAIKEWMPKNIGDLERTEYKIGSEMGMFKVNDIILAYSAKVEANPQKKFRLKIIDGAGKGATIISSYKFGLSQEVDNESSSGYERVEEFDGQRVLVKYSNPKYSNSSILKYMIENRIYVEATGWNMKPEELWDYLDEMNIEELMK